MRDGSAARAAAASRWAIHHLRRCPTAALGGVGFDLVELEQVARHIQRPAYRHQLCEEGEAATCLRASDPALAFAERLAFKEACMKALGAGIREGLWFRQIEMTIGPGGIARARLRRRALERLHQVGGARVEGVVTRLDTLVVALAWIERN